MKIEDRSVLKSKKKLKKQIARLERHVRFLERKVGVMQEGIDELMALAYGHEEPTEIQGTIFLGSDKN